MCNIGEIGDFVVSLRTMTSRTIISACGNSAEKTDALGDFYFQSAPANAAEKADSDYDGWLEGNAQVGKNMYMW